jgi:hypothetical protein
MNTAKPPPKNVPILTRVAQPSGFTPLASSHSGLGGLYPASGPEVGAPPSAARLQGTAPAALDVHALTLRVLQRIDGILESRIREAVAAVALEHARGIADDIRPAIEAAVHDAISQAIALEAQRKS